jgi:hypothetical protein
LLRQPRSGKADDDGVVAGENEIDEDNLQESRQHTVVKTEWHPAIPQGNSALQRAM